nr:hypothetical protein [uncultured Duganella sp.]
MTEYLELIDSLIHGAVVTVAIDKKVSSIFGMTKREAHASITKQLEEGGFGKWTGHVGEKVLRVLHILAALTAAMTYDQQRLFWYSNTDQMSFACRIDPLRLTLPSGPRERRAPVLRPLESQFL